MVFGLTYIAYMLMLIGMRDEFLWAAYDKDADDPRFDLGKRDT
jgi:hypothetical protein